MCDCGIGCGEYFHFSKVGEDHRYMAQKIGTEVHIVHHQKILMKL